MPTGAVEELTRSTPGFEPDQFACHPSRYTRSDETLTPRAGLRQSMAGPKRRASRAALKAPPETRVVSGANAKQAPASADPYVFGRNLHGFAQESPDGGERRPAPERQRDLLACAGGDGKPSDRGAGGVRRRGRARAPLRPCAQARLHRQPEGGPRDLLKERFGHADHRGRGGLAIHQPRPAGSDRPSRLRSSPSPTGPASGRASSAC